MHRIAFLALTVATAAGPARAAAASARVRVVRDRGCSCCEGWVAALIGAGYRVDLVDLDHTERVRRFRIPEQLASCHTAFLAGYAIEGHVPIAALAKLERERPRTRGLILPGMPLGSPGMPGPKGELRVLLLDDLARTYFIG